MSMRKKEKSLAAKFKEKFLNLGAALFDKCLGAKNSDKLHHLIANVVNITTGHTSGAEISSRGRDLDR